MNNTRVLLNSSAVSALVFALSLSAVGCNKNDLPDYNRLGGLRVLALKASAPESSVGSSVTVTPVVSDLDGHGRAVTYTATGCTDPGVGFGATPSCQNVPDRTVLGSGTINPQPSSFTLASGAVTFTVPATVLLGRNTTEQFNGVNYLVVYEFRAGDQVLSAFKRVRVSTNPVKNSNPTLSDIQVNGTSLTALPSEHVTVTPVLTTPESYSVMGTNGALVTNQEVLTTTWFISEGSFDRQRTDESGTNGFSPGQRSLDHDVVMVVVTHDDRGGEDFLIRSF